MNILVVLIGSFMFGVLLQIVLNHFSQERELVPQQVKNLWSSFRGKAHIMVVAYLLIHIGLIGGAEVAHEGLASLAIPAVICIGLALIIFIVAFLTLNTFSLEDRQTRISLATHFGSVSVGTFAAAQAFLRSRQIPFASATSAWLAMMEVPSILIGACMLGGGIKSLKDTFGDRDILLLLITLVAGFVLGPRLVHKLDFIIVAPFEAVLAYFLFDMGQHAGEYIEHLRDKGMKLVFFGIFMALFGGVVGCLAGTLIGMHLGNVIILSTLSASASYVAATAVMNKLVTPKALATTLTVSLGITLPWNILLGIQLYTFLAKSIHNLQGNPSLLGLMLTWWMILICGGLYAWPRLKMMKRLSFSPAGQEGAFGGSE